MIYAYGVTEIGTYHIQKNTVCQDAHKIIKINDSFVVAAVADGLGSESHSDIASKMAVDIATTYCAEKITADMEEVEITNIICSSFCLSQTSIEQKAKENHDELDQYDTTLSLAVLIGDQLYYGQSGDSGIIAMTDHGLFEKVTEQQRDDEGRVFPLYFGKEKWIFGKYPGTVVSVFLATDGMYEILFPIYIRNEPVSIYTALAQFFMDGNRLGIAEVGEETTEMRIREFIHNIPDEQVNDDKTVVVLFNSEVQVNYQEDDYYAQPDWNSLKKKYDEEWRRKAYPHLYAETPSLSDNSSTDETYSEDGAEVKGSDVPASKE